MRVEGRLRFDPEPHRFRADLALLATVDEGQWRPVNVHPEEDFVGLLVDDALQITEHQMRTTWGLVCERSSAGRRESASSGTNANTSHIYRNCRIDCWLIRCDISIYSLAVHDLLVEWSVVWAPFAVTGDFQFRQGSCRGPTVISQPCRRSWLSFAYHIAVEVAIVLFTSRS